MTLRYLLFLCICTHVGAQQPAKVGTFVTDHITSTILKDNLIGLDLNRSITVYLPADYGTSKKSYPVIYYFHGLGINNEKVFGDTLKKQTLDRVISRGVIGQFILVAADYSSPTIGSWYENSSTSGKWIDYTMQEIVPFVDSHYRTIKSSASRAVIGEYMGAYGAMKLALLYPDTFGIVYALHPVGTGQGLSPATATADWKRIYEAKEFKDLWGDRYAPGFVAMSQAYLPNPGRPPFYCDFFVDLIDGKPQMNSANIKKLHASFFFDQLMMAHEVNLRKLIAIAFDWGRYDNTQAHIYSNQALTRKLDDLGIEHTAEEYNGGPFEKNWIPHGRVEDRAMPFLSRWLKFQ